mmetsp:Transcript_25407/g.101245  ORF Transcript_25407/g.101245 Transcript_25407/m.101245 type:complete len:210 (+) Transcript_25407:1530-2159(+)
MCNPCVAMKASQELCPDAHESLPMPVSGQCSVVVVSLSATAVFRSHAMPSCCCASSERHDAERHTAVVTQLPVRGFLFAVTSHSLSVLFRSLANAAAARMVSLGWIQMKESSATNMQLRANACFTDATAFCSAGSLLSTDETEETIKSGSLYLATRARVTQPSSSLTGVVLELGSMYTNVRAFCINLATDLDSASGDRSAKSAAKLRAV